MRLSLGLLLLSALAASALEEEVVNEELNAIIVEGEKEDYFKRCRSFQGIGNISSINGQKFHSVTTCYVVPDLPTVELAFWLDY